MNELYLSPFLGSKTFFEFVLKCEIFASFSWLSTIVYREELMLLVSFSTDSHSLVYRLP